MLKKLTLGLMAVLSTSAVMAAGFGAQDAGVYELVTLKNNQPAGLSGIQMRLTHQNGRWAMDGKDGTLKGAAKNQWQNICSTSNCDFQASTGSQLQAIFPQLAQMKKADDIGCIQNQVQAFCRFDSKAQKGYTSYMMVALQSKPPVQMILQRQE
ncbi:hypothetical protein [Vitreoscilla stercoraria]|uniref:DUF306 domain-containing protein n=1 Tax=Vitreoscilla stercoraria TaxID=61 RepID=A0ABY4EAM8_VITST|nr:hypothetical protein [Vitreoscilla stercoraria]UOO92383.1 hypothetical protein LVJ81_12395 [Vitreoscilla stercoraria]